MNSQDRSSLFDDLTLALESRQALFDAEQSSALRLFNGFAEGGWRLTADVYGRTLLLISHEKSLAEAQDALTEAQGFLIKRLPWLTCVIHKARAGRFCAAASLLLGASPTAASANTASITPSI